MKRAVSRVTACISACAIVCSGCAMQGTVQRETVEYNTAIYGMANQLTLLNIVRAEKGLPTFYTSISRLSGSITVKAVASMGAQIKASQPTTTNSTNTQTANGTGSSTSFMNGSGGSTSTATTNGASETQAISTGSSGNTNTDMANNSTVVTNGGTTNTSSAIGATTTAATTVTNLVQTAVSRGGNIYTPNVSGEIDSGPSFDINILDTQAFYQGILSGIDGKTFLNYLDQGADSDLLMRLLVAKIEFKANNDGVNYKKGQVIWTWNNAPLDNILATAKSTSFWPIAQCYALSTQQTKPDDTSIALVSSVNLSANGHDGMKLSDLALLDGTQLGLKYTSRKNDPPGAKPPAKDKSYIGSDDVSNDNLLIVKPGQKKESLALFLRPSSPTANCEFPDKGVNSLFSNRKMFDPRPVSTDSDVGDVTNRASDQGELIPFTDDVRGTAIPVTLDVVTRSPESVIQYIGSYLREYPAQNAIPDEFKLRHIPLFAVTEGRCPREVVGVDLMGKHYCIDNDDNDQRTAGGSGNGSQVSRDMTVLALVEQLIDLNKSATDRPTTVPVEVVP